MAVTPHTVNPPTVDWWQVVERVSWVVVIPASVIGVPLAYIQLVLLRRDQKRIADDLARRPELEVGFLPVKKEGTRMVPAKTISIKPRWRLGHEKSEPVMFHIACCNNGERTARDVLYNISVQQGFDWVPTKPPQGENVIRNPITGLSTWVSRDVYVHAHDIATFETTVAVAKGREKVDFHVEVSCDYGPLDVDLSLTIE